MKKHKYYPVGKKLDKLIHTKVLKLKSNELIMPYSKNNLWGFTIWEKIVNSGSWCCTDLGSDYNYVYIAKLTPGYGLTRLDDEHKPAIIMESTISFAHLICNVALEAQKYIDKHKKKKVAVVRK